MQLGHYEGAFNRTCAADGDSETPAVSNDTEIHSTPRRAQHQFCELLWRFCGDCQDAMPNMSAIISAHVSGVRACFWGSLLQCRSFWAALFFWSKGYLQSHRLDRKRPRARHRHAYPPVDASCFQNVLTECSGVREGLNTSIQAQEE